MIYFDNAATSGKKPQSVINAVKNALVFYSANPGRSGHTLSQKCTEKVYEVRQKASDFFGSNGPETVMFTLNCTHSINCVLKGVIKKGDHVITSELEHNAVWRPLVKTGASHSFFKVDFNDSHKTVEDFKSKIKPNTKLVICTGASNVWGKILPIKEIGEICKSKGILFAVDAAQIAGILPIDMKKMNIDYLCVAPHKGLYAPMGIGLLICRKPIENTLMEGGSGTNSIDAFQPLEFPERMECGTANMPSILGVGEGLDFVKSKGIENMYNHEFGLILMLYDGLKQNDKILLYTKRPTYGEYAPVLSFNVKGNSSEKTAALLSENGFAVRGGLHCSPLAHKAMKTIDQGAVRVSVAAFNTKNEIKAFLNYFNIKKY